MRLLSYPDARQVVVCGDIHGDFKTLVYKLCIQYGHTDTLCIVAGDCGFGFFKPGYYEDIYASVLPRLEKANNWVVFVRGNHDNPAYFAEERVSHPRWRCIPDYTVIDACGKNILCVGGAVSIDRKDRQEENARRREYGHMETAVWWPDEALVFRKEEIDALPEDVVIDTVVTHTAPSFCEPAIKQGLKSWAVMDPGLVWDTEKERKTMDELFAYLKENGHPVFSWLYGHFHRSWNGIREGTRWSMLDILEFRQL